MSETTLRVIEPGEAERLVAAASLAARDGKAGIPEFTRAEISHAALTVSSMLMRISFHGSRLTDIDFAGSNLDDAAFGEARVVRCNLSDVLAARLYAEEATFESCTFARSYLSRAHFKRARLATCDFTRAVMSNAFCVGASLENSTLNGAEFDLAWLDGADLTGAACRGTIFKRAHMSGAKLPGVDLKDADLSDANLSGALLEGADLRGARLTGADLRRVRLAHARLDGCDLSHANLSGADLRRADLTGARVYGVSAWDVTLEDTVQRGLVIAPAGQSPITVDDLEVAQFVYLLSHNPKIRRVIDTITSRVVLILGRFTPERKAVLDAIREELRQRDWVPILFDFDKPSERDFTETIMTLAGMSRFVVADITNPKSSPLELQATVPNYMIPFVPIIHKGEEPFSMFADLRGKYAGWVLDPLTYDTVENLRRGFHKAIIEPAVKRHAELLARRTQDVAMRDIADYV